MMNFARIFFTLFLCSLCFAQDNTPLEKPEHCYDSVSWAGKSAECFEEKDLPTAKFSPTKGVEVSIEFKGIRDASSSKGAKENSFIRFAPVYKIESNRGNVYEEITDAWEDNLVPKSIIIDDYNFDGLMDFAIAQYDGGKGVYDVCRVFTYSKKLNRFLEHYTENGPFFNLVVDKKHKWLLYTCWEPASPMPKQCKIKLSSKTVIQNMQKTE